MTMVSSATRISSAAPTITSLIGPANILTNSRIPMATESLISPPANILNAFARLIRLTDKAPNPTEIAGFAPIANNPSKTPAMPTTPATTSPRLRLASPLKAGVKINSAVANSRQAPATPVIPAVAAGSIAAAPTNPKSATPSAITLFTRSDTLRSLSILIACAISISAKPIAANAAAAPMLSIAFLPRT